MKIYTRRGDSGETDLFAGGRVGKDDVRVEAYGAVDELLAVLGTAAADSAQPDLRMLVSDLQCTLFALGSYLATPDAEMPAIGPLMTPHVTALASVARKVASSRSCQAASCRVAVSFTVRAAEFTNKPATP